METNEKQTARKVGFVSAMCAATGVPLGWGAKMQFGFGWWIVPVAALGAGGLAWFMYDLAGVRTGVKQAWREVTGWKPDWARVGRLFKIWFYVGVVFSSAFLLLGILIPDIPASLLVAWLVVWNVFVGIFSMMMSEQLETSENQPPMSLKR